MKKRVAIIYGGYSSEVIIAKKSAILIFNHIDLGLFEPILVEITPNNWLVYIDGKPEEINKNDFSYTVKNQKNKFDIAFITIHGTPGEDGKLQAYFDMIGLHYANSNCFASALTFNKWACNSFLRDFGVSTAKAILLRSPHEAHPIQIADELGFPCFVKPNDGGSSFGISKVNTLTEMPEAIAKAFDEGEEVVIESFIKGREMTCGLYDNGKEIIAFPVTEIITTNDFFDFGAKYNGESNEVTPAEIENTLSDAIKTNAKNIYRRIGMVGLARIDYIVTETNELFLIEANTNPGMTEESIVPQQIKAYGVNLKDILTEIIQLKLT